MERAARPDFHTPKSACHGTASSLVLQKVGLHGQRLAGAIEFYAIECLTCSLEMLELLSQVGRCSGSLKDQPHMELITSGSCSYSIRSAVEQIEGLQSCRSWAPTEITKKSVWEIQRLKPDEWACIHKTFDPFR
ncbi:hypothetical protein GW17_00031589 [Ensete ventricosum]|uniref:Uncharacterized protein n=1 Tax=Ensete ventricosum TaxID=4639 RepID=A0A444E433_ENSVE|nr:hypothetical protein B296_00054507 [Ensete ventricosum]RWW05155.1 hypothetical protein GW17_00031589 [Ensete ventricosum]